MTLIVAPPLVAPVGSPTAEPAAAIQTVSSELGLPGLVAVALRLKEQKAGAAALARLVGNVLQVPGAPTLTPLIVKE